MDKHSTSGKSVKVTLVKSVSGQLHRHRATASGLGLRRMNQKVVRPDNPAIRGMVATIPHLVRVVGE